MNKKIIYADHSATTQVRPEVIAAMAKVMEENFGNPSSIHQHGRKAKEYLNKARRNVASVINANEEQIFFTSGGTESDNIVILGLARYFEEEGIRGKEKHIISSKIEHPAIKEPLEYLEKKGWEITWLNVDKEGFINLNELQSSISPRTLLVSIIHANNEIGTIQDLKRISNVCKKNKVLFHTDAVQSFCKIPIDVKSLNIDFLSMSAHKIYGAKGTGALYIKSKDYVLPLLIGGGQEEQIRPGTENLPGVVGFGLAASLLNSEMYENAKKLRKLQTGLMKDLSNTENIMLSGVGVDKVKENIPDEKYLYRIPGHVSICVKNIEGENLVLQMDLNGIAVSSGSACSSGTLEPSHVIVACGVPKDYLRGSLRITLGRESTEADVKNVIDSLNSVLNKISKKTVTV